MSLIEIGCLVLGVCIDRVNVNNRGVEEKLLLSFSSLRIVIATFMYKMFALMQDSGVPNAIWGPPASPGPEQWWIAAPACATVTAGAPAAPHSHHIRLQILAARLFPAEIARLCRADALRPVQCSILCGQRPQL